MSVDKQITPQLRLQSHSPFPHASSHLYQQQPLPAYSIPRTMSSFNSFPTENLPQEERPENQYDDFTNPAHFNNPYPAYANNNTWPQSHYGIRVDTSAIQHHQSQQQQQQQQHHSPSLYANSYPTPTWSDGHRSSSSQYASPGYQSEPAYTYTIHGGVPYSGSSTAGISPSGSAELMLTPGTSSIHLSPTMSTRPSPPSPDTPGSQGHLPFSSSPVDQSASSHFPTPPINRPLYSHREQQQFFKDAMSLPAVHINGPFIPQIMYKPHTNSDRRRYVEEVDLEAPIHFWVENPQECGILLSDAIHSRVKRLQNRDETVFEGRGPSVSIRLEWPGYRQWSRQIPTRDFRSPPGPITRAKLAKNVAKCVQRFINERYNQPLEDEVDQRWRVGFDSNRIRFEDLVLVSMHHVSMGSWQPQLRLRRG